MPYAGTAENLASICAIHHQRILSKDLVIKFKRQRYILQTDGNPCYAMRGKTITVVEYADGRFEFWDGRKVLACRVFDEAKQASPPVPVDDKELNFKVDQIIQRRRKTTTPAKNHPWRRFAPPAPTRLYRQVGAEKPAN